jgi:hypothetical protein
MIMAREKPLRILATDVDRAMPLRVVAYDSGRLVEEAYYENWAQVGGKIGNLVGDVESIAVYEGGRRVLFYHIDGIH